MSKITLTSLANLDNPTTAVAQINANFAAIAAAWDINLSRDGTVPNYLVSPLDMNSNRIVNVATPVNLTDAARLADVGNAPAYAAAAAASAAAALASQNAAASTLTTIYSFWCGAANNDPTTDQNGNPLVGGDLYWNFNTGLRVYNGITHLWQGYNSAALNTVFGRTGDVVATTGDYAVAQVTGAAPLASPTFTGTPAAPTAAPGTNTTQLATTAFVVASFAPLASPALSGTPTAPTAAANTNTTQIATTAFVLGQVGTANPLMNGTVAVGTSFLYARQDHVHPSDTSRLATAGNQTVTGGFNLTPFNQTAGSFTVAPLNGNYQFINNSAAYTITAPASDCAVDLLVTNVTGAGATTFSGFTVSANTGDPLTTTVGSKFLISIRRINSISTYTIKALQ